MNMKKIQLNKMTIHNFKGFSDFTIDFNGEDIDIHGDNDAGKTSIYDAFLWGLFHKDSKDRTQFDWKPLDSDNKPINGLITSIIIELLVDGQPMVFEKQRISKKVVRRKNNLEVYEDTPKYLVNGLETSTRDMYDQKVAEVMDQEAFKNLTSVTYFSEQLSADERREKLFEYFGTMTDVEIIKKHKPLLPLIEIMGRDSVNDARAKIMQESRQVNETLKSIPTKIEGIMAAMPEIADLNRDELSKDRLKLSEKKSDLQDQLTTIKSGGGISEFRSKLRSKEEELKAEQLSYETSQNAKVNGIEQGKAQLFGELNDAKSSLSAIEISRQKIQQDIESDKAYITRLETEHQLLIEKYDEVDESAFEPAVFVKTPFDEHLLSCSYCQRPYKQAEQEAMRKHHEEEEARKEQDHHAKQMNLANEFEAQKQAELDAIRSQGQENNKEREATAESLLENQTLLADDKDYQAAKKKVTDLETQMQDVIAQIAKLEANQVPFDQSKKYEKINKEIVQLNEFIAQGNQDLAPQIAAQEKLIADVELDIEAIDEKLATFKEYDRQTEVIESFNEQERNLSARKGELQAQLVLFEEFFITKQNLLEDRINSHFHVVKWKLFDFYEEGGLNESFCEPMIGGVPFRSLNNGSRMQAGLDVSNTLMRVEGYQVPIFIDNAEGLTNHKREEVPVDTQVIAMYVNEADKNLRVVPHQVERVGVA